MPYGGRPKSGWRLVDEAFIEASHAPLWPFTGRAETSVFQMLSEGKTSQFVPGTGALGAERRADGLAGAPFEIPKVIRAMASPAKTEATLVVLSRMPTPLDLGGGDPWGR